MDGSMAKAGIGAVLGLALALVFAATEGRGDSLRKIVRKPLVSNDVNPGSESSGSSVLGEANLVETKVVPEDLQAMPAHAGAPVRIQAQIYRLAPTGGEISERVALQQIEEGTATLIGNPCSATAMNTWFGQKVVSEIPFPKNYLLPRIPESYAGHVVTGSRGEHWVVGEADGALPGFPDLLGNREVGLKMKFRPRELADGKLVIDVEADQTILKGFVLRDEPIVMEKAREQGTKKKKLTLLENGMVDPVFDDGRETVNFTMGGDADRYVSNVFFAESKPEFTGDDLPPASIYTSNLSPLFVRVKASKIATRKVPAQRDVGKDKTQIYVVSRFVELSNELGHADESFGQSFTSGIYSQPEFQLLVRSLNQKKGIDLLSAPSIMLRNSQQGRMQITREFIYPRKYDPPKTVAAAGSGGFPVSPAVPTAFTVKDVGVTLQVLAELSSEKGMIDLQLKTDVNEFGGFLDFGEPIRTFEANAWGKDVPVILSENRILAPVFHSRFQETSVRISDGSTLCVGGFIREEIQKLEDKIPILGDLPGIGSLARKEVELKLQRELYLFVTAQLMDSSGLPVQEKP